jgi:4-hydroxy-3-polyprenylbenzoate decarboxylase
MTMGYPDFQAHLANLEANGLLVRIDRPIDKDTQLHPLVRWQFQGGLAESQRKAFLFTNVVDGSGHRYDIPVAPIEPVRVGAAPCQEVVVAGDDLRVRGNGIDRFPVPISTPGYDASPYLAATVVTTKDPETGVRNMGTYRAALKASDRLGVRMATRVGGAGGYLHWKKYRERGEPMPCAIVVGAPPAVAFTGPQKLPVGKDEMGVAGALAGEPIRIVPAKTVDLEVPADAEIVVEGLIDTELLEPEGPFGESHGYVALEDFNLSMQITAITCKTNPVFASIISQVTPSESSVLKRVAYEPLFLTHLRDELEVTGILQVTMHEALSNIRPVIFLRFADGTARDEVWKGLHGAARIISTQSSGRWPIARVRQRISRSFVTARSVTDRSQGAERATRAFSSTRPGSMTCLHWRYRVGPTWRLRARSGRNSAFPSCRSVRLGTAIRSVIGTKPGSASRSRPLPVAGMKMASKPMHGDAAE